MPTNEPSDLPVDCTVETTQQQDIVDYRTADAGGEARKLDPAGSQAKYAHELLFATAVSVIFTLVATSLSGNLQGLICGFSLSGLLTAYWAYFNYRICKDNQVSLSNGAIGSSEADPGRADFQPVPRREASTVSPMRCLAMSVFVNQFGVAHAALFANSVLELIFPVLRTIRPPDLVMTFANCVGGAFALLVVVVVAVLTVWWHIVLAKEVYGAHSQAGVVKAAAIGCLFAVTATWLLITAGASNFFTTAPIAVNCCFVFVFMFARLIILERDQPAPATLEAPRSPAMSEAPSVACTSSNPLPDESVSATSAVIAETASLSPAVTPVVSDLLTVTPVEDVSPGSEAPEDSEALSAPGEVITTSAGASVLPPTPRKDLTAEWLLLLTYVLTVYLSNPLAVSYGIFASLFSGVPAAVWFVYLLMETRSGARLSAAKQTHTL